MAGDVKTVEVAELLDRQSGLGDPVEGPAGVGGELAIDSRNAMIRKISRTSVTPVPTILWIAVT